MADNPYFTLQGMRALVALPGALPSSPFLKVNHLVHSPVVSESHLFHSPGTLARYGTSACELSSLKRGVVGSLSFR